MRKLITKNRRPSALGYESLELRQMLAFVGPGSLPYVPSIHIPQDTWAVVQTGLDSAPEISQHPEHGELQFNSDAGTLTYRPANGFTGADTFQLGEQTFSMRVWEPVYAVSGWAHVQPGTSATLNVLNNDYSLRQSSFGSPDGYNNFHWQRDSSGFRIVDFYSSTANVSISGDGRSLNYIPGRDFVGTDTLTYTLEDALGNRSQATVTIDVTEQNPNGHYFFSDAQWKQQRIDSWLENNASLFTADSMNYFECGDMDMGARFSVTGVSLSTAPFDMTSLLSRNQVANVNEGDIVQSKGNLIYYVTHGTESNLGQREFASYLSIIDVSDPNAPTVVSTTGFAKRIQDMFLGEGRVAIVFGPEQSVSIFGNIPSVWGSYFDANESRFELLVLDSTTPGTPTEVYRATMDGVYREGRLIGDELFVISDNPVDHGPGRRFFEESFVAVSPGDFVEAMIMRDPHLNLPSITIDAGGQSTTITAGARQIVDRENTSSTTLVATFDLQSNNGIPTDFDVVESHRVQTIYVSENAIYLFDHESVIQMSFMVDGAGVEFAADGEFRGYLLSQFSADEYEGYLRVALTDSADGSNDIRVFKQIDDQLVVVGSIEDLAPGERIYSTRFAEDQLFVVTFRVVDPLFVIDLSNPQAPTVTGELKIPGVSGYLQLIGDDLLLAVGRDVDQNSTWFGNLQISLFDISDPKAPRLLDQYSFQGGRSTNTPLMNWVGSAPNQQALTLDPSTGILALPIFSEEIWGSLPMFENGASAISLFKVNRENGIQVQGQVDFNGLALRTMIVGDNLVYLSAEGMQTANRSAPNKIMSNMMFSTDGATVLAVQRVSSEEVPVEEVPVEEVLVEELTKEELPKDEAPAELVSSDEPIADNQQFVDNEPAPFEAAPILSEPDIADLVELSPAIALVIEQASEATPVAVPALAADLALFPHDVNFARNSFAAIKSSFNVDQVRFSDGWVGTEEILGDGRAVEAEALKGKQRLTGFALNETQNEGKSIDRAAFDAFFAEMPLDTELDLLTLVI